MTKIEKSKVKELQNELVNLLLKKAGLNRRDVYSVALTNWVNKNLNLLTPIEVQKYQPVIL